MSTADVEVLVVGAGIAGLAAARDLVAGGVRPLVVDANPHAGGVMQPLITASNGTRWLGA